MALSLGLLLALAAACEHRVAPTAVAPIPSCLGPEGGALAWTRPLHDRRLDEWCAQVGSPVVATVPPDAAVRPTRLLVVSWNVHVGGGRVVELVEHLRRLHAKKGEVVGFVLLLQEVFRAGGDIPAAAAGEGVPIAIRPIRPALDVVALGRYLGMSVAYVPSMRNGQDEGVDGAEDRGNAVLSTESLSDVRAIELPFGKQRRVAVAATVSPRGAAPRFIAVSAHLDTFFGDAQRRQAESLAGTLHALVTERERLPLVVGADTNAKDGPKGPTLQALSREVAAIADCGRRPTASVFRIDVLLSTLEPALTTACVTWPDKSGSDHRPLVLTLGG